MKAPESLQTPSRQAIAGRAGRLEIAGRGHLPRVAR